MAYDGFNRLGRVLQNRMSDVSYKAPVIDFGTIRSDLALIPDGLNLVIPKDDYAVMISHHDCKDCPNRGYCNVEKNWKPEEGDRVVVAWADSDVVILGKIRG